MTLDTPTLFTSVMVAKLAGSAILILFFLFWKACGPVCARSLAIWSCGMFLAGSGAFLIAMRGVVPDGFSILAANTLVILGTGLGRSGFATFLGARPAIWLNFVVAGVWVVLCFYPPFFESFLARVNFVQSYLILTCLSVVWIAFRRNRDNLRTVRLLGVTTLIECTGYAWFTVNQNVLLYPDFLYAFGENFMTAYLVTILLSIVMTILLPACMIVERSLNGFREQANQDALTGLANRRSFLNGTQNWLSQSRVDNGTFSLIMVDLDGFKSVNDRYGHAMGDAVLQLFGRVLKDTLDVSAVPGRLGGEEFAVFLPDCGQEPALLTARRVCRRFSVECREASGGKLTVTASAGVVTAGGKVTLERALEAADKGLYKAKRQGKAQIVTMDFTPDGALQNSVAEAGFSSLRRKAA
ncbi:GGDEF domain-containing protein [Roseibium marinum]|uniref:diguanylate cyclase n=1 Tax=Roseibium marinum TaxID=281252 RepID=A0A2S3UJ44_9HYPH|nr:GGDEF domain-containing protein [Roseibium marinum]POF27706.1 diguanylate cyclase (GGDEF)-like protein [Roseibium marinum]